MITLVTGATGFLGSTLIQRLVTEGVRVRGLRRSTSSLDLIDPEFRSDIEWVTGDILDRDSLDKSLQDVTRVFHCAAFLDFSGKIRRRKIMDVNVGGTANVVNASLTSGIERLVHTSSVAALSRSELATDCLDESSTWIESKLNTSYGTSKYLAELEIHRGIAEGLDALMVNPSLIMGCGRTGENTMQLAELVQAGKMPFYPVGATSVVDVLDVTQGLVRAMDSGRCGRRYILAGSNLTWSELTATLALALDVKPPRREISPSAMLVIATLAEIFGNISGTKPRVTRESARVSASVSCYDNSRSIAELGMTYRPFESTARRIAAELS